MVAVQLEQISSKSSLEGQCVCLHTDCPSNQMTGQQYKDLMAALPQELPGILNWAIEGCLRWQTESLIAPQSVQASVTEYRTEMDTVCSFVTEECLVAPHERIQVGSLYQQYTNWCRSSSKQPRTKVQFGKALTDKGYKRMRDINGRYWQGLSISITG